MSKVILQVLFNMTQLSIFAHGEMPERLIGTVLKTVEGDEPSGGSNPSLSAEMKSPSNDGLFIFLAGIKKNPQKLLAQ